jgi:hypothetical protein
MITDSHIILYLTEGDKQFIKIQIMSESFILLNNSLLSL